MERNPVFASSAEAIAFQMVASERHQRKVRLSIIIAGFTFFLFMNYYQPVVAHPILLKLFFVTIGASTMTILWQMYRARCRGAEDTYSEPRVFIGQVFDVTVMSLGFSCFGPNAIYTFPVFLILVLGNGMRFGLRPLVTSTSMSVIGLGLVFYFSEYWQTQDRLMFCFIFGQIGVSTYFAVLVNRINKARDFIVKNEKSKVELLKEMAELRSRVFANISHEFRTPITLTLGSLELMQKHNYRKDFLEKQSDVIRRSQERLLRLVNQILDIDKMEKGKFTLNVQPILQFNEFVRARVDQFQTLAQKKNLRLVANYDSRLDNEAVYGDPDNLDKVIFNLLSNAFKFTFSGQVQVQTEMKDDKILITVKDTGMGIRRDQLNRIFERFHQASSKDFSGTGIGLALAKEIVELHGGKIAAVSDYGKGTTFCVHLHRGSGFFSPEQISDVVYSEKEKGEKKVQSEAIDVMEVEGAEYHWRHNRQMERAKSSNKKTLLYVDDNYDLREFIKDGIGKDYNLFFGVDGEDGLRVAESVRPDLIISDLMMPKLDGIGFLKRVRENPILKNVPFLILTAKVTKESMADAWGAGADEILYKPFTRDQLATSIKTFLSADHPSGHRPALLSI